MCVRGGGVGTALAPSPSPFLNSTLSRTYSDILEMLSILTVIRERFIVFLSAFIFILDVYEYARFV